MIANVNPKASNLDPRWPLPSVDMVYVRERPGGIWELRDFFGDVILETNNRSACFFKAAHHGLQFSVRH